MKPYAGEKGGHKNMRDVDKWSQSRPHGEVGRPAGFAHVKKKPGKSAARQAGKRDASEIDEDATCLDEMKPYGVRGEDDEPAPKTSKAGKHGYHNPASKDAFRRGFKKRARQKGKGEVRAQVGEAYLRKIVREEFRKLLEGAGYPEHEYERAMKIAKEQIASGEDPLSIGFHLENMGFMPNVVDSVMEAI